MSVTSREQDGVLIAYFTDSRILDESKIQEIGTSLLKLITQTTEGRMLLNFKNVTFMSSAMLGKLILLNKKCKAGKVDLRLCEIAPSIMEVFKVMKLHKVLNIQKSEEAAIESFDKKGFFG